MEIEPQTSFKLLAPFTLTLSGATMSGKTQLVKRILQNANDFIFPPPVHVILSFTEHQKAYDDIMETIPNVKLIKGFF